MDFFKKSAKPAPTSDEPGSTELSNTDLFGSAKVLAGAAQAQYTGQTDSYDNAELAGAGANVLGAASEYGKFDETRGVGKYVNDAEGYLKQYSSTNTKSSTVEPIATPEINSSVDYTEGADASEGYGVDKEDGFSKKSAVVDASDEYGKSGEEEYFPKKASVEKDTTEDFEKKQYGGSGGAKFAGSDETDTYGDENATDFTDKPSGGGFASEVKYGQSEDEDKDDGYSTKISDPYNTGNDEISGKFGKSSYGDDDTEESFEKKPLGGGSYGDQNTKESFEKKPLGGGGGSYGDDTEESFEKKPFGGGDSTGADESGDGYGQYGKKAGGFYNKE